MLVGKLAGIEHGDDVGKDRLDCIQTFGRTEEPTIGPLRWEVWMRMRWNGAMVGPLYYNTLNGR
jgi:hypothetical protein